LSFHLPPSALSVKTNPIPCYRSAAVSKSLEGSGFAVRGTEGIDSSPGSPPALETAELRFGGLISIPSTNTGEMNQNSQPSFKTHCPALPSEGNNSNFYSKQY
jgi:hypothetical protein